MNGLNFNIFNIKILAGILHGLIFVLVIFTNKKLGSKSNKFLALTIISLSLSNLQYLLIDTNIIPRFYYEQDILLYIPFEFLILPFFYFFVKSFIQQEIIKREIITIFFSFTFCIFYILIRNSLSKEIIIVKLLNLIVEYISIVFSLIIIVLIFMLLKKHEKNNITSFNEIFIKTKWLKKKFDFRCIPLSFMGLII